MSVTHTHVPPVPLKQDECPIRDVLDRVGDKWSVLIVVQLGQGTHRFTELERSIEGISQRMLTHTLRALVRDGLVMRRAYPTVPMRVEYSLTDLGRTLLVPITALQEWATVHREDVQRSRVRYDDGP